MLIIATSPDALKVDGKPDPEIVKALIAAQAAGNHVGLISNHAKPPWFDDAFAGAHVQFLSTRGRQDGRIISKNSAHFSLQPYDALVLAAKPEDVQMGKKGGRSYRCWLGVTTTTSPNPALYEFNLSENPHRWVPAGC
jgi:hypothetical protein